MFSLIRQFSALGIEGSVDAPEVLATPLFANGGLQMQPWPQTQNPKPSSIYPLACNLAAACSVFA